MGRGCWLLALCLIGSSAAQNETLVADNAASARATTCEDSTAGACVRTCCAEAENVINGACAPGTLKWEPSFLSTQDLADLELVGGFISPCGVGRREVVLGAIIDPLTVFRLGPTGDLDVDTSDHTYSMGHEYCFYNVEHGGRLHESVRGCAPIEVPQVDGLANIDTLASVSVRKCCPLGQALARGLADGGLDCVNASTPWRPQLIHGDPTQLIQVPPEKVNITAGPLFTCPEKSTTGYWTATNVDQANFLQANGELRLARYNLTIRSGMFCQDRLRSASSTLKPISVACYGMSDEHTKEEFEALCPEGVCVRKCCAPHFHMSSISCVPTKQSWQPTFYEGEEPVDHEVQYTIVHGRSSCKDGTTFQFSSSLTPEDVPRLQADGEIHVPKLELVFKAHQCCLDNEIKFNAESGMMEINEIATCCYPNDKEVEVRDVVTSVLLTISAVCLFVMLAIYMLVPKLRNIHGKCLMSHATALFVAFFLTVYNHVVSLHLGAGCDALGLMIYYSFIAALFWLNVMSFDIWWTFAHLLTQPPSERSLRNRFIRHSLYAWGVPLLMTGLLAFFNYAPYSVLPEGAILRPRLGERKCFLSGSDSELYYFYVPIFIVTIVNIVFFLATAWTLYKAERSSRILNRKRTARDRLKVYVNLFIVMEVSWIAECLSTQIGPIQAWYFTDIINASQGTLIFLLFIVRSGTRKAIKSRVLELSKNGLNFGKGKIHPTRNAGQCGSATPNTKTTATTSSSGSSARKTSEHGGVPMQPLANAKTPNDGREVGTSDREVGTSGREVGTSGREVESSGREVETPGQEVVPTSCRPDLLRSSGREIETSGREVGTSGREVETPGREVETPGREVGTSDREVGTSGREVETSDPEADGSSAAASQDQAPADTHC